MTLLPSFRSQCTIRKLQTLLLLIIFIGAEASGIAPEAPEECKNYAPPAVIKGNKIFVSTTGEYLPIKGINYYPRPNEGMLRNGNSQDFYDENFRSSWERDIANFKKLGVNAIRLYAVDPGLNHDAFMCSLKAAGIYVIVGLAADCANCAVQWQDPPLCYPQNLKDRGEFIIQEFARYENVLGFSAGNEVALSAQTYLGNLPCQKRFLRDMRAFVQKCTAEGAMRHIPVGIIFADHEREVKAKYYNCRSNPEDELENAEFVGINTYLHCDGQQTNIDELIGYRTLLAGVESWGMTIPVMWTEFGCLNPSFEQVGAYEAQRNFLQVDALFSPEYRQHFSGGFVFEYSTEKVYSEQQSPFPFTGFGTGNYGVGYFAPEDCNEIDIPCEYIPFPQFENLAARYNAVDASNEVTMDTYNPPQRDLPACPDRVPGLSAFDWPTEFDIASDRTLQCPALVPVYCAGIPANCVTVPHPGTGGQILIESDGIVANVTAPTTPDAAPTVAPTGAAAPEATASDASAPPSTSPAPTDAPSLRPTATPTGSPTTNSPTFLPTEPAPTQEPTLSPTSSEPTFEPTANPTKDPSRAPSKMPISLPDLTAGNNGGGDGPETLLISGARREGWFFAATFAIWLFLMV